MNMAKTTISQTRATFSTLMALPRLRMDRHVTNVRKMRHQAHTGTWGRYWFSAWPAWMNMRSGVMRYCRSMSQPATKPTAGEMVWLA